MEGGHGEPLRFTQRTGTAISWHVRCVQAGAHGPCELWQAGKITGWHSPPRLHMLDSSTLDAC